MLAQGRRGRRGRRRRRDRPAESEAGRDQPQPPSDEDEVLLAGVGPAVEPAVERLDLEAGALEEPAPLERREPREAASSTPRRRAARRASACARPRPSRPARRSRARARASGRASRRCPPWPGRRRRRRGGRPGTSSSRAAASARSRSALGRHVQQRAERDQDERDALVDRRLAQVAEAEVDELGDAVAPRRAPGDLEHRGRAVDADDADAGLRDRDGDPAGAARELDDGAAGGDRLLDVELDVLGDARAPRVVEPRDRVVRVCRATQTNSEPSPNGSRSNPP